MTRTKANRRKALIHTRDLVLTNDYLLNEQVIRRRKLFDDKYKLSSVVEYRYSIEIATRPALYMGSYEVM